METKEKIKVNNVIQRAKIQLSIDDSYDFECVAVPTINGQLQYLRDEDGCRMYDENWNPIIFNQILLVTPENVNVERLDSGLPLFDNHPEMDDISVLTTLGITTSYLFDERGLVVKCKFGSRADEGLRNDVKNGIIKTVSIEGTIQEYGRIEQTNEQRYANYYATKWTPESLSFAPVPNDIGAQIETKRAYSKLKNKEIEGTKEPSLLNNLINKF
ncbi:MAG TPA: hypothetical protein VIK86_05570 [Candidatus Paceibacterota bacterium]